MATGLGEPVYGLSEDEVSGSPFPPGTPWGVPAWRRQGVGTGATPGVRFPVPAREPQTPELPRAESGVGGVGGCSGPSAGRLRPLPQPSALFVNKAVRCPWSPGSLAAFHL